MSLDQKGKLGNLLKPSARNGFRLLVLVLAAGLVYGCFEIRSLKRRISSDEKWLQSVHGMIDDTNWRLDGVYGSTYNSEYAVGGIEYTVLSTADEKVRVADYSNQETTYKTEEMLVVKVRAKNNSAGVSIVDSAAVRGKTASGELITDNTLDVHPDDVKDKAVYELAAGGSSEYYLYFLKTGKKIVALYITPTNTTVDL